MSLLAYQPGEIGFAISNQVKRVRDHSAGAALSAPAVPTTAGLERLGPTARCATAGESFVLSQERVAEPPGAWVCAQKSCARNRLFGCQFANRDGSYAIDITPPATKALCRPTTTLPPQAATTAAWPKRTAIGRGAPWPCQTAAGARSCLLRGSCDFDEPADNTARLLSEVFQCPHAPSAAALMSRSSRSWATLPAFRFADYELLTVACA